MKRGLLTTVWVLTSILGSVALLSVDQRAGAEADSFSFAVIGDGPYTEWEEDQYLAVIDEINARDDLAFTIHAGDIKSGISPCTDASMVTMISDRSRANAIQAEIPFCWRR